MLIKNGIIVSSEKTLKSDILVKDGKIYKISENISSENETVINAEGKYIIPGGIDVHVHMDLPSHVGKSSDSFLTGSKAALAGGTTTIIDFVTPEKGESYLEALEKRKLEAKDCLCNYNFHMSPTWFGENSAQEIHDCIANENINSFKVYLAYKKVVGIEDDILFKVMKAVAKENSMMTLHCEMGDEVEENRARFISEGKTSPKYHPLSRPNHTEADAVAKAIKMAKETNCTIYIVHVSTKESVDLIREAQKTGQKVFAETCSQYLLLDDSVYDQEFNEAAKFVLSPPIRKKADQIALWNALKDGTIQTLATDHCPFHTKGQKDFGIDNFTKIPNGAGGVEHRLSLLYTYGVLENKISINQFVDICATKPAEIFKLKNKGKIEVGFDADLVIWDSKKESVISAKTHTQNCDSNIFEGFKIKGMPDIVILGGEIIN